MKGTYRFGRQMPFSTRETNNGGSNRRDKINCTKCDKNGHYAEECESSEDDAVHVMRGSTEIILPL